MLGRVTLYRSNLAQEYPVSPPEMLGLMFPTIGLAGVESKVIRCYVSYESRCSLRYSHRVHMSSYDEGPRLSIGDRLIMAVASTDDRKGWLTSRKLPGWIIGVHFELDTFMEFTVLSIIEGLLQVIFLSVPQKFLDRCRLPPTTICVGTRLFWTYMTPFETEARARVLQNVGPSLEHWSSSARDVQKFLFQLRMSHIGEFYGIDPEYLPPVGFSCLYTIKICTFDFDRCFS